MPSHFLQEQFVIGLLSIIAVGFFLGMRHATDPDHVIAVTTIVSRQRDIMRAAWTGIFWGLGHTITIFVVGVGIILFDLVIPIRLGLSMELSVAFMLIFLGVMNVNSFRRSLPEISATTHANGGIVHSHAHAHGDYVHIHPHQHFSDMPSHTHNQTPLAFLDRIFAGSGFYQHVRPLVIGLVHGLAGSAAVALLVLATIPNSRWAIAYLLVFGVGTIAGMMVITMSIASTFHLVGRKRAGFTRKLSLASGLISLVFGLIVAYQICFVQGFFSAHPHWTPH
jgi:high-affinity nickel-transport protein